MLLLHFLALFCSVCADLIGTGVERLLILRTITQEIFLDERVCSITIQPHGYHVCYIMLTLKLSCIELYFDLTEVVEEGLVRNAWHYFLEILIELDA